MSGEDTIFFIEKVATLQFNPYASYSKKQITKIYLIFIILRKNYYFCALLSEKLTY
jgi:hypothetical protein